MSNASKYRKKAVEYEQLKQFDRAIASYARAIEENENASEDVDVALFNKVGDLTLRQGRVSEAVTYYERAVEHYVSNNLFDNAIALCNKILRNAPGRSNVYFTLGRICARKGLRSDATRNFLEYATRMQQEGRVDEGMRALAEVADLMPELTEVHRLVEEHAARAGISLSRKRETPVRSAAQPEAEAYRSFGLSKDLVFLEIDYDVAKPMRGKTPPPQRSVMADVTNAVVSSIAASDAAKNALQEKPISAALATASASSAAPAPATRLEDLMIFDPRNSDPVATVDVTEATVVDGASILRPYVDPETPVISLTDLEPTMLDESVQETVVPPEPISNVLQRGVAPRAAGDSSEDEPLVVVQVKTEPNFPAITFDEKVVALDGVETGISATLFIEPPVLAHVDAPLVEETDAELADIASENAHRIDHVVTNEIAEHDSIDSISADAVGVAQGDDSLVEAAAVELTAPVTIEADEVMRDDIAPDASALETFAPADITSVDITSALDETASLEVPAQGNEPREIAVAALDEHVSGESEIAVSAVAEGATAEQGLQSHEFVPEFVQPLAELASDSYTPAAHELAAIDAIGTVEQEFSAPVDAEFPDGFSADEVPPTIAEIPAPEPVNELIAEEVEATTEHVPAVADVLPSLDFDAMLAMTQPSLIAIPDVGAEVFDVVEHAVINVADSSDALASELPGSEKLSGEMLSGETLSSETLVDSFDSPNELPPLIFFDAAADSESNVEAHADDAPANVSLGSASLDEVVAEDLGLNNVALDNIAFDGAAQPVDAVGFDIADTINLDALTPDAFGSVQPVVQDAFKPVTLIDLDAITVDEFKPVTLIDLEAVALDPFEPIVLDVVEPIATEAVDEIAFVDDELPGAVEEETIAAASSELVFLDVSADAPRNSVTPEQPSLDDVTFDADALDDIAFDGDTFDNASLEIASQSSAGNADNLGAIVEDELADDDLGDLFGDTGVHVAVAAAEATIVASSRCAELQSASDADPENFVLRRRLAESLFEAGNRDAAISELGAALAVAELRGLLGDAADIADELVRVNGDDVAHHQKRLELAIRLSDQNRLRDAYLDLADTLVRRGEDLRAKAVYARVLEIDPYDDRARTALGDAAPPAPIRPSAASDEGHVNLAEWLREDDEPTSTRLRMREPDVTGDEQDDFNALLRHFKEGVSRSLGEDDYESHYDLGVAYKEMGLLDDAIGEFQMALRSRNNRLAAYEALGQCFLEQESYKVAVTVLSRALHEPGVQDEQRVGILYLLGYSCEVLQRFDEARSYFQRVYATDIHFRDVAQRLADLERTVR